VIQGNGTPGTPDTRSTLTEVTTTREPARDLAAELREQITAGRLLPGVKLPPARELAATSNVALATAVRAVGTLRHEGLVTTTRGRGSYVAVRREITRWDASRYRFHPDGLSANRDEAAAGGYLDEIIHTERSTTDATPELADRLGISVGAPLSVVRFLFAAGGLPTQLATQWEPLDLTAGTSAELPSSGERGEPDTIERFRRIGWKATWTTEEYRARIPRRDEVAALELPSGVPVLTITRRQFGKDTHDTERVIETADITARADRVFIRSEHPVRQGSPRARSTPPQRAVAEAERTR